MADNPGFYPAQASTIRIGGYILIRDRPCKVINMSTSKTGKHGHAKINFTATDIFTEKKMEEICQSTHNINVPLVTRKEYQLLDIDEDGYVTLFDDETNESTEDQKLRDKKVDLDIKKNFEEGKDLIVTVISAMGESAVIDFKESK